MDDRYTTDVLEWSEHQARLLRALAAGQHINEAPDWDNIIEEVESVGQSQLQAVRSLLVQALLHELKAQAWPLSHEVPHWRAEARRIRGDVADTFTPSMRQRIDLAKIYRRALRSMPDTIDAKAPAPVPEECPFTLEELLGED